MFTILALMLLIPLSVNAEVKEFKDKVYVINEHDIKDYYCEELKNKENVFLDYYTYNEVYLYDYSAGNTPDRYLLDMNNKSCKLISEEEFEKIIKKNKKTTMRLEKEKYMNFLQEKKKKLQH